MHPDRSPHRQLAAVLASRVADDSSAEQIAAACGVLWLELFAVLAPIIGPRGVTALGQRSLHLASVAHPWLAARQPGGPAMLDAASLESVLAQRSSDEAADAGHAFLQNFHELLSSLIGDSLTERLLRSVWGTPDTSSTGFIEQDPTT